MEYRILGPLEVLDAGRTIAVKGSKPKALLIDLLLHANLVLSVDRLIDDLWGDPPPETARSALQVHVSHLRRAFGTDAPRTILQTRSPGYQLVVGLDELDAVVFERMVAEGRGLLALGDAAGAAARLADALGLWRGDALADVAFEAFAQPHARRLEELRLDVAQDRIDADLACGRHAAVIGELERLIETEPLRERLTAQLMLALYRSGRQADALGLFDRTRANLADQLGIDPGAELRGMHTAILRQEPELEWTTPSSPVAPATAGPGPADVREPPGPTPEERRVVSILVCGLVRDRVPPGGVDPEDLRSSVEPSHERIRRELAIFGGSIIGGVGDTVVAAFGASSAHEDDPERAVRAALRIIECVGTPAGGGEADAEQPFARARIGVATGDVLVTVAPEGRNPPGTAGAERVLAGEVLGTAARLQAAAAPGTALIDERTYRATERIFGCDGPSETDTGGDSRPLIAWRPLAARSRYGTDFTRDFTTPFVGRDAELALLRTAFDRAARDRSLQLATVVGEPGVGKSRLVAELFAVLDARQEVTIWRQGRCLPYGEGITFWALGEIVKAHAGIFDSDPPDAVRAKLRDAVADDHEREWVLQRLLPLVGLDAPAAERGEIFAAWRSFLRSIADVHPAVLVVEDIHWADPAMLLFLEDLADRPDVAPMLVICTARPEFLLERPDWSGGRRNSMTIALAPLSGPETATLVSALIETQGVASDHGQRVLERVGGNPLYAEEFVRLLKDERSRSGHATGPASVGDPEAGVPPGVHGIISARLAALSPDRRRVLHAASVIGKVFWADAIASMLDGSDREPAAAFDDLTRREMIRPSRVSSIQGEDEFGFWHVLIRDVAYAQIPRAERGRLHLAAARWIESRAGGRLDDVAEILAAHHTAAAELAAARGRTEEARLLGAEARRFLGLAAQRTLGLDIGQTEAVLARALALASPDDADHPELLARWADAARQGGRYAAASAALAEAEDAFLARGDPLGAAKAMLTHASVAWHLGDESYGTLGSRAVELLERGGPSGDLLDAYALLAGQSSVEGESAHALAWADRAIALAADMRREPPVSALGFRGYARCQLGDTAGLDDMRKALRMSLAQGNGRQTAVLYHNLAFLTYGVDGAAAAVAAFDEGIAFAERRGISEAELWMRASRVGVLVTTGGIEAALDEAPKLLRRLEASGDVHSLADVRAAYVLALVRHGEPRRALPLVASMLEDVDREPPDRSIPALTNAAMVRAALGDMADARALVHRVAAVPSGRESPNYASCLPDLARVAAAAGDLEVVDRLLADFEPARPLDRCCVLSVRATRAEAGGDPMRAAKLYRQAERAWAAFDERSEQAFASLGRGRCLLAAGERGAADALEHARATFDDLRWPAQVADADAVLSTMPVLKSALRRQESGPQPPDRMPGEGSPVA